MLSGKMKKQLLQFLRDDISKGDVTSAVVPALKCRARVIVKEGCTIAGLEEAKFLFKSRGVKARPSVKDGAAVKRGRIVMRLEGVNRNIFAVERTALNVLGRMSGVATAAAEARGIAGKGVGVALTRKTMPGFNLFDNRAAEIAGIWTHRISLSSFVLLKDNHLPFFDSAFDAVTAARKRYGGRMKVEVEVESLGQALDAARAGPAIIMLDNIGPKKAGAVIKRLRAVFRGKIELSGGVSMKNLGQYAAAKPDIVSMGSLTRCAASKNFSLEVY